MYAIFEDLITAYIGPFANIEEVKAHRAFCRARGDGAVYKGTVTELPADPMFVLSPQQDRDYKE